MAKNRRRFGSIRKLPSGRYQVRYCGPDGQMRNAPTTFERKEEAGRWLALTEAQLVKQEWIDPQRGKVTLNEYGQRWIDERPKLRPRTIGLYRQLLRSHLRPRLGNVSLADLNTPMIRAWRSDLISEGTSRLVVAKSYRLLRAILNTAVKEDELIRVNPCRIPGADTEESGERPVLSMAQIFALADEVPAPYRAMVLITAFACLRWGEVTALHRSDIDLRKATVRVRHSYGEVEGQGLVLGPPKSKAGRRTVSIPSSIAQELKTHLETYVPSSPDALVFTGQSVRRPPLRRNNFAKLVGWREAVTKIGVPGLHFHDLRHTGNTLAAATGTSTRDLMTRMGHDSARAALMYQHATARADRAIADALDAEVQALTRTRDDAEEDVPTEEAASGPHSVCEDVAGESDGRQGDEGSGGAALA